MTTIDSPTTDAAMVLKAHVAELLASRQVKPGNKLLLKETVTEKDATKPFSLTPTGKIISVRVPPLLPHYAVLFPLFFFFHVSLRTPSPRFLVSSTVRPRNTPTNKYLQSKVGHAWGVRANQQLAGVGYIEKYGEFKAKGISEIYIITMNDRFPTKVWKEKLAPDGTPVRFITDDQALFRVGLRLVDVTSVFEAL